jgi:hypothetical protein
MGAARTWPVAKAWAVAVEVVATSYGLDPEVLRAESRGRGPRPPEDAREPKKIAVFLAVALSNCAYAALARHISLHKDTIASHCDDVRDACAKDYTREQLVDALMILGAGRLASGDTQAARSRDDATIFGLLVALHSRFDRLERGFAARIVHPSTTDEGALHPSFEPDHADVIDALDAPGEDLEDDEREVASEDDAA